MPTLLTSVEHLTLLFALSAHRRGGLLGWAGLRALHCSAGTARHNWLGAHYELTSAVDDENEKRSRESGDD